MRLFTVIRIYRAFKGLKIKPLADEIGISAKALAQIEDGNTPKGDVLAKVLTWAMGEEKEVKPGEWEPIKVKEEEELPHV